MYCLHYFGPEYDTERIRKKVLDHISNEICLHCHDNLLGKPGSSAARKPEACGQCHLGPDHPQIEIFEESKQGKESG